MPPQPPQSAAPLLRVDRQGTYSISLGSSISEPSTYQSIKYNYKPKSTLCNPSSPTLKPGSSPSTYNLTFTPSSSAKIQYSGTGAHPPPRRQHFLLYDPATKKLTLEKLDTALVFNADVFAAAHPPLPRELSEDEDEDSDADAQGAYDFRNFLGKKKKTAAEEKQEKRMQALKRAGRTVVEVEDQEPEREFGVGGMAMGTTPNRIPDRRYGGDGEMDSEIDAPGEDEDDEDIEIPDVYAAAAAATDREQRQRRARATAAAAPVVGLGLDMNFEYEDTPRRDPRGDSRRDPEELVLPDLGVDEEDDDPSGEEELEFSGEDEDEPMPTPAAAAPTKDPSPPPQQQDDEEVDDFDFLGNELEAALGGGDDGLIMDEDEDEAPQHHMNNVGGAPRSLIQNQGGASYLDDSSESEEE